MRNYLKLIIPVLIYLLGFTSVYACSGYKLTLGNKTVFGSNEDAWRLTSRLWFENAMAKSQYGAAFTGSRFDGENGFAPQSGMNEMGLAFERLASYHPKLDKKSGEKEITNPTIYLKNILHTCKNVEEVKAYIENYDYSFFIEDVFLYVDKSGKYLVVEPYKIIEGADDKYVISNFCPSITSQEYALGLGRYRNGISFLNNKIDTSLEFCKALSDTMHVCRNKIGDGTLLTSIWDLQNGIFNLYFYHDFSKTIQYNLKEELLKGDTLIAIDSLFPINAEFQKLASYQIPKNNIKIAVFILFSAVIFLMTFLYLGFLFFRNINKGKFPVIGKLLIPLSLAMFYYMYVLSGSITVFYFDAPYYDSSNILISLSSYLPFVVLVSILPLIYFGFQSIKNRNLNKLSIMLLIVNSLVYLGLIGLFNYWGFYQII